MGKVYIRLRAYNAEETLCRALDSVLNQTYKDFLFYVCDNGSTDKTRRIIKSYADRDARVVPFYNAENMVYDEHTVVFRDLPRNLQDDDFYCVLDADDEYHPAFLENMLAFMERHRLDIVCCGTEMFIAPENRPAGNRSVGVDIVLERSQYGEYFPQYHAFMRPNWAKIFRGFTARALVTDSDSEPNWPRAYGGDTVSSFRALRRANRMGIMAKVYHKYYIMPASISTKFSANRIKCDQILFEDALDFLKPYGPVSQRNWSFLYVVYMNALLDTVNVIFQAGISTTEKLDAIIEVCDCPYTKNLAAWKFFPEATQNQRYQLFASLATWLLSLKDVPVSHAEPFYHTGSFVCAAAGHAKGWIFFEQFYIMFLAQSGRKEEAKAKLEELSALTPGDGFIQEWKEKLNAQASPPPPPRISSEEYLERLTEETNLGAYLDLLRRAAEQYTVLIAVRDTPWGTSFTPFLTAKLLAMGLKTDLYGKYRYAYGAVIDRGKVIFERMPSARNQKAAWSGKIGKVKAALESRGFELSPSAAKIEIGGRDYSVSLRGLNIVVYDKETDAVLDTVNFDTYAETLTCSRPAKLAEELLKWRASHPDVAVFCFNKPDFPKDNLTPNEQFILKNVHSQGDSYRLIDHPKLPLRRFFSSREEILEVITPPKSYHDASGVRRFEDTRGKRVNTFAGRRRTVNQPEKGEKTIFMVGGCSTFGIGAPDEGTIASHLQRLCNEQIPENRIVVQNYGYYLAEADRETMEEMRILESLPVKPGDIVLCDFGLTDKIPLVDVSGEGKRPHEYGELFFDMGPSSGHLTENGYRMTADKLFERLRAEKLLESASPAGQPLRAFSLSEENKASLEEYKNRLRALYQERFSVGAIVMNCNPFTLGHRYLIEQAAKQCAHLILFVVEEDRSFFPFKDRMALVEAGTSDLKNVTVLPSGAFIISSLTFSEYFNKSQLQERSVDASMDVHIFASEIAPCLHITARFLGEEPIDQVTNQYNQEMKELLPRYGIEVVETSRLEIEGRPISASWVRDCLEKRDFDTIRKLTPPATCEYLRTFKKA